MAKVLYIEDDADDAVILEHILEQTRTLQNNFHLIMDFHASGTNKFELIHASRLTAGLQKLRETEIDIVLLDLSLPDGDSLHSFERLHREFPTIPVAVLSGLKDDAMAIKAVQLGAQDYLVKGEVTGPILLRSLTYAIERQRMLTKVEKLREREHFMAYHDPLTGLANRQLFFDHLNHALAQSRRRRTKLAVLFIDLDGFKQINDSLGHQYGDAVLVACANRIKGCVRESDTIARLGGDEFAVILDSIMDENDARIVAEKISTLLSRPIIQKIKEATVSASIGISLYPDDGAHDELLVRMADTAMYEAKAAGKNCIRMFNQISKLRQHGKWRNEKHLRNALRCNEFELYYQPQFDVQHSCCTGAEALLRWHHPDDGLILPSEFLPMAEETGMIEKIGEWVLHDICEQSKRWRQHQLPFERISMNISSRQFRDQKIVHKLRDIIHEYKLPPGVLALELKERTVSQDLGFAMVMFDQLKQLGAHIVIDDFSATYIPIMYLGKLPVDAIKIDNLQIRTMLGDNYDPSVIGTLVILAHQFHIQVIAERVETAQELDYYRSVQCDEVQGYHVGRPMPVEMLSNINSVADPQPVFTAVFGAS
ncbi:EAL domain-containing protein [candidate division KSB1 bacterium]|nr:EAL domain-containing protein [candidate division KSB1 bacterium]